LWLDTFFMQTKQGISTHRLALCGAIVAMLVAAPFSAANAGWIEKPRPHLPYGVYVEGLHGSVIVSLVMDPSGRVTGTQVIRSSGFAALDRLAQEAAMNWRLSPDSVVATDTTQGRLEKITFLNPPPHPKSLLPNSMPYWAVVR
jgi:TonB family protein